MSAACGDRLYRADAVAKAWIIGGRIALAVFFLVAAAASTLAAEKPAKDTARLWVFSPDVDPASAGDAEVEAVPKDLALDIEERVKIGLVTLCTREKELYLELFEQQSREFREDMLGEGTVKIAIEAAVRG